MKNKILDKHLANQKRIEKALTAHIKQRNRNPGRKNTPAIPLSQNRSI